VPLLHRVQSKSIPAAFECNHWVLKTDKSGMIMTTSLLNNPKILNSLYAGMERLAFDPTNQADSQGLFSNLRALAKEVREVLPQRSKDVEQTEDFRTVRISSYVLQEKADRCRALQYAGEEGKRILIVSDFSDGEISEGSAEFIRSDRGMTLGILSFFFSKEQSCTFSVGTKVYCQIENDAAILDDLKSRFELTVGNSMGALARTIYNLSTGTGSPYEDHEESFKCVGQNGFSALTYDRDKDKLSSFFKYTHDRGLSMAFYQQPLPSVIRKRLWQWPT